MKSSPPEDSRDASSGEDGSSTQLQNELLTFISRVSDSPRPILTHLNADSSWLLSIPYPLHQKPPSGRCRYNILIDPWFRGPQVDGVGWFSTQWHAIESSVQHVADIESLLQQAETLERKASAASPETLNDSSMPSYIDAVVISHEFTDHCHRTTLQEVHPSVPIFATSKAATLISSWSHFETVVNMMHFTEGIDWRTTSISPLPSWIGISRIVTKGDALYLHAAVTICISGPQSAAEAVIYTPHGVTASTLSVLNSARPSVTTLALMHGLHDVSLWYAKQINLGAYNALEAQKILHSKYWVGTHDEVKKESGIVSSILRRKPHTITGALTLEDSTTLMDEDRDMEHLMKEVGFRSCGNGQSLVLL